ncbi:MAG: hypothetical protein WCF65_05810, partial [Parachlamydiaceae bacterium]
VPLFCFVEKQKRGTSPWFSFVSFRFPYLHSARRLAPLGMGYRTREKRAKKRIESHPSFFLVPGSLYFLNEFL